MSSTTPDGVSGREQLLAQQRMHSMISSVDVKSEVPVGLEPISPLDLRTDLRMMVPMVDPIMREKQLQQELLLIQQQQQIQKQLLIAEFQKQHENLTRQHQAQLQEHIKLQQELLAIKQQQELLEKEQKLEQQRQEQELERHRREQQLPPLRGKERGRERAVASTEVKQKLQEFLLSKSATKDSPANGKNHSMSRHPKLWYTAAHHTSLDQSSPPLSGASPPYKYTLPGAQDAKDDFPLRKTASEPNLKVRSRLKQKVTERRSSPLLRRKDGNVVSSFKKRLFEVTESSVSSSSPGSGPSSPSNGPTSSITENETSVLPSNIQAEHLVSQQRLLIQDESVNLLSLYTSPSLPNITLGLPAVQPQISGVRECSRKSNSFPLLQASSSFKEKQKGDTQSLRQGVALAGQYGGNIPPASPHPHVALEGKPNSSHQALLQHLLLKEQMRQQKLLVTGAVPLHPQSPLAAKERVSPGIRAAHRLPRHRPLNRTQSAPLPQSTLAQLVIQQQHQQFLEKQKQYQQQIHMNKMLSKSIEQLKQPGSHLEEAEEELHGDHSMQEEQAPASGASVRAESSSAGVDDRIGQQVGAVKVKEEPPDSDEDVQTQQMESGEQAAFMQQEFLAHQRVHQLEIYQAQMATVGMAGLDKHRPVSRTPSSPADSTLPHPAVDQASQHVYTTGNLSQKLFSLLPCGGLGNGFAVVRPPGHHAEESTAMGFCFFNSIAITAKYLRDKLNIGKILIVDLDVHHGNGTQQAFYADPSILYVSLHRYDEGNFFPGSGAPNEVGSGPGEGYNINIAWTGGLDPPMGDVEYLTAFRTVIMPAANEFDPEIVLVSAGFDAVEGHDPPLGGYKVTAKCFGHLTKQLLKLADGRVVLALEGGHDLTAICDASEACINALLGNELEPLPEDIVHQIPNMNAIASLKKTTEIQSKYWKSVEPYSVPVDCALAESQKQEREETETVSAMASLSVDVEQCIPQEGSRAAGEPMEEEPAL
ncbi:histone deacetylase 9 isoform X10 [Mycteria americana]|uniref:histone deacetylase 9 isoform X10 n=1 Tax=Mycteria americana TaxID=33587 RepID=UPI003F58C940